MQLKKTAPDNYPNRKRHRIYTKLCMRAPRPEHGGTPPEPARTREKKSAAPPPKLFHNVLERIGRRPQTGPHRDTGAGNARPVQSDAPCRPRPCVLVS